MSNLEMAQAAADEILDPPTVASELRIPEKTLAQWRYQGKGPRWFRLGRHARYLRSDIDAYIAAQRAATAR